MTKEYLKMADVFPCGTIVDTDQHYNGWAVIEVKYENQNTATIDESGDGGFYEKTANYISHAINSHDELVEQNENMKLRINQLLSERNATGVAIEKALNGILPEQHSMINRLQMIAGVAANRDELVAEVERLRAELALYKTYQLGA